MKISCQNESGGCDVEMTLTELAELKALISVAVWVRSEQLAHTEEVIQIDCHDLVKPILRAEMMAGTRLYKQLQAMELPEVSWARLFK